MIAAAPPPPAHVIVLPADRIPHAGARGLLVPGAGESVSRRGALAALLRGETRKSLLGGVPKGPPKIHLSTTPGALTVYVSLPPPGSHRNDRRYPVAVVGPGYRGLLNSDSTRIPGLIGIADIAPFALGRRHLSAEAVADVDGRLRDLDRRLDQQDRARNWAVGVLAFGVILASLLTLWTRSRRVGLAALTVAPAVFGTSIVIAAAGGGRPAVVVPVLIGGTFAAAALMSVLGLPERVAAAFAAGFAALLVVLVARPVWAALATIGPNPSEGGRFYGLSNLSSTVLLTVALFAGAKLPLRVLAAVAALSVLTVGWSRAGADGGGLVVFVTAFAVLAVRMAGGRVTPRSAALAAAGAIAAGLALVGLDAAAGGHSHVTRKVGQGPGALLDELGSRLHISGERIVSGWHPALVFGLGIAALAVLATRGPRFAAGDALLVGIVVSLLVNDTPTDVASGGAISYGVLWAWERVDSRADASPPAASPRRAGPGRGLRRQGDGQPPPGDGRGQGADDAAGEG